MKILQQIFTEKYVPITYNIEPFTIFRNRMKITLKIWDVSEQDDQFRRIYYSDVDLFIVCYAINNKESFNNAQMIWIPEIKFNKPKVPYILVGTKEDERSMSDDVVSEKEAIGVAKYLGAKVHILCSAANNYNINYLISSALDYTCNYNEK
ncbi:Rac/Rho-like_protein [Hexamita inflata]|uniref:Rac/Rho-like protein n=1 Tax=Hexamita inflata TaxID=28002 RepID=A0AA86RPW1_9EUKA|nr:Rac/Rho-like protein [Hexamita inflata]